MAPSLVLVLIHSPLVGAFSPKPQPDPRLVAVRSPRGPSRAALVGCS